MIELLLSMDDAMVLTMEEDPCKGSQRKCCKVYYGGGSSSSLCSCSCSFSLGCDDQFSDGGVCYDGG